jgi:serine/threonine protein kinase
MTLSAGTKLGPYEILAPLGAGGMGEVYRAKDMRLDRHVALKVLPEALAGDADTLSRFEREAKTVAALSHPNILAIHDFGSDAGRVYAVAELLEGSTLRERLSEGALPVRKAVDYGIQIARGLAAAHEKGIVHRDLKPENLFVTEDGRVKILDFGLASHAPVVPAVDDTQTPTVEGRTEPGTVMGTVGYMSPEQVRGLPADQRSDIFSFGAVLYEMLSGGRAFRRDTSVETMTAILKEDPPGLADAAAKVPTGLDRIVRHCLEKNPAERFQSARDVAFDLAAAEDLSGVASPTVGEPAAPRIRRVLVPAALLLVGVVIGAAIVRSTRPPPPEPVRVRPLTFSGHDGEPSASSDGRLVAFTSTRDGVSRIWIKQLSGGEAPLTSGPDRRPRFSPDGASVLFLRPGEDGSRTDAWRVALVGGEPRRILQDVTDADWAPDGQRIAFLRPNAEGERRSSSIGVADVRGGQERILASVRDLELQFVRWSPTGRLIAVIRLAPIGFEPPAEVLLVDAESGKERRLARRAGFPISGLVWSDSGEEVLYAEAGSRLGDSSGALARVVAKRIASGRERTLFWSLDLFPTIGSTKTFATLDVLGPGRVVFDEITQRMNLREVSIGRETLPPDVRALTEGSSRDRQPAYSPDGEQIVFSSNRSGNLDLWSLSTKTGALTQLTDDPAQDWDPGFLPDGRHVVWSSDRSGNLEIWTANADGSGARQLTRDGKDAENPTATRDGSWIVYTSGDPAKNGIWKIRPDGSDATRLVPGVASNAEVSPDGRYASYVRWITGIGLARKVDVVEIETGRVVPFEIQLRQQTGLSTSSVLAGRTRWLPGGRAIAWIGEDENGTTGVFAQDFDPERDTSASRRKLAGFSPDYVTESFGISPDGRHATLSVMRQSSNLMLAEGVPGIEPRSPRPAR